MRKIFGAMSLWVLIGCAGTVNSDVNAEHVKTDANSNQTIKVSAGEPMQVMSQAVLNGHLDVVPFYQNAKSMPVSLTVTNQAEHGVDIQFNSGMTADLWLLNPSGVKIWAWSETMMFTQALRQVRIGAGKSLKANFNVPAEVLAKINTNGYRLQAKFVGKVQESDLPSMNDIIVELQLAE